jgi:hypothetical protein
MAQIYTSVEFKFYTEPEYNAFKMIAEETFDFPELWPVSEYNDENRSIKTKDVLRSNDDAVELVKQLDKQLLTIADQAEDAKLKDFFRGIKYTLSGKTEDTNFGETTEFIIQRSQDGNLTYQERHSMPEEMIEELFDGFEGEVPPSFEANFTKPVGIDDYQMAGELMSIDPEDVERYFKEHGFKYSEEIYDSLDADDIYEIMEGTYQPK